MESFRRIEQKYFLNEEQYNTLTEKINKHLKKDSHGFSTISNIYFDNDFNDLVINSNEKPIYKEKIRLRSYNKIDLNSKVFLEIKRKYDGIVSKRRVIITLKEFYDYYNNGILPDCNKQVMKEIDYAFKYYDLKPKLFLAYDRFAYYATCDDNFRITFDYNIRSRKDNLKLEIDEDNQYLFDYKYYVMEVKTLEAMPLWLVDVLSDLKIYPVSFSKYGSIFRKDVENVH